MSLSSTTLSRALRNALIFATAAAALALQGAPALADSTPSASEIGGTGHDAGLAGVQAGTGGLSRTLDGDDGVPIGNDTGGDVSVNPPADTLQARLKQRLANAYASAKRGTGSMAAYWALEGEYRETYGDGTSADAMGSSTTGASAQIATSSSRYLSVSWYQQQKSYYCGPASGYMLLHYRGNVYSAADGRTLSQTTLANTNHMKTDQYGVTSWGSGLWASGINMFREGTRGGYFQQVHAPSGSEFENATVYSIDKSFPFGSDTVEFSGGIHYNSHPDRTIGHWLLAIAYSSYGATAGFNDPAAGLSGGYESSARYFYYDASTFANRFLQSNGIAY